MNKCVNITKFRLGEPSMATQKSYFLPSLAKFGGPFLDANLVWQALVGLHLAMPPYFSSKYCIGGLFGEPCDDALSKSKPFQNLLRFGLPNFRQGLKKVVLLSSHTKLSIVTFFFPCMYSFQYEYYMSMYYINNMCNLYK